MHLTKNPKNNTKKPYIHFANFKDANLRIKTK